MIDRFYLYGSETKWMPSAYRKSNEEKIEIRGIEEGRLFVHQRFQGCWILSVKCCREVCPGMHFLTFLIPVEAYPVYNVFL